MKRTLLFDIDGTLLTTAGGGYRALARALREEFDVEQPDVDIIFSGRTDHSIVVELLQRNKVSPTATACGRLRRRYLHFFDDELQKTGGIVLPGVPELLSQLAERSEANVAVMTGNFPESAHRKLEYFQLRQHVQWIVGGNLDAHRDDLARRAAKLIVQRYGNDALNNVIVIGDTPADVQCAHAIGARCVAVATGIHDLEELRLANPWQLCPDLSGTEELVTMLLHG